MPSVCFYFQVHQPYRLRRYTVFDQDRRYCDESLNAEICRKVARKCYLPANRLLLDLIRRHDGRFRVAYSLSGPILEQIEEYVPEVLDTFCDLNATGCVEFLAETYYHSLSFLYSRDEFTEQVEKHCRRMEKLFGRRPTVFRNTELIYNNDLANFVGDMGFVGCLCEGVDQLLGDRSPNHVYESPSSDSLSLLLKNYRLSDDIAFRFSNQAWPEWPLTIDKYVEWIGSAPKGGGEVVNLFMDYETLGEHQWVDTGIFDFIGRLPDALLQAGHDFLTPTQVIREYAPRGVYDVPNMTSWADTERDLSAWLGNAMQSNALHELYRLAPQVCASGDAELLRDWRLLQTSDHFYYMCTKYFADGDVHNYFNPYDSPYDSYINYMNVVDNLRSRLSRPQPIRRLLKQHA